jgi:hypothetical protein
MVESSGDQTGTDLKAAVWAPMPFYDEASKRWNMYYVAYRSKPNDDGGWYVNYDGRIIRAISQTPGPAGLKGPWKDAGIALEPDWEPWKEKRSQPWEGLQGTDSMSPPYAVAGLLRQRPNTKSREEPGVQDVECWFGGSLSPDRAVETPCGGQSDAFWRLRRKSHRLAIAGRLLFDGL